MSETSHLHTATNGGYPFSAIAKDDPSIGRSDSWDGPAASGNGDKTTTPAAKVDAKAAPAAKAKAKQGATPDSTTTTSTTPVTKEADLEKAAE